jgi:hypothetical protein
MRDSGGALWKIAQTLIGKFGQRLGHVDADKILFARVVGSSASWLGKVWRIKSPYHLLAAVDGGEAFEYILAINDDRCRGVFVSPLMEVMVVLHELQHIGRDGKLEKHDVEDFAWMIREFGVDWAHGASSDKIQEVIDLFEGQSQGIEESPEGVS